MDQMPDQPSKEISETSGGDNDADDLLPIRHLEISDHGKGFVELLGQLSTCPPISDADFSSRFADLSALGDDHVISVIEDLKTGRIVATGSVFVEKKFIHGCGKVAHIEDVVVDAAARGRCLGQRVVRFLAEHARVAGCYKVILDCTSELRGFYEKCGFVEKNVQMAMYFRD
ncbi:glucosamine 6-phosphate N-acetyltransferase 1 [Phalaenopsis equestris]|uniref:glucosamine 6-phosphate N-acetyltransferase 1 n=1 Tax=Phalaenopsis equestris TaxID=78828 RepID=UPI0009E3AE28|nr:glucosamine 6-phosphate N-acetyltransferase 1 [Phalaenopsis equestris]XP_020592823.1 glucosamine 6-phosphate N-acetyltransferase 1 [Phalaenopsis equestris]XP_020592824.1 glucosamine 6-phosphate N-acetyltransferase 1 [Phalaenopsis equestris]XP_020592825.1 glucosamine 6-phosphate N-acetyltransferase 1 [Phalaenopsis equestris]XP_020592826.1 glucosamine 6-phosphate N-acetyltransferase 1 [Phalaenopsis equestris]XP_020592827.1 glucosamine 6-phosphate N-acetyltransferase 1 [Phalaenopsis equestris]